jgi:hypothetical protein
MKLILACTCCLLCSCVSVQPGPDASLFPDKGESWREGFRAGMLEGIMLTITIPL